MRKQGTGVWAGEGQVTGIRAKVREHLVTRWRMIGCCDFPCTRLLTVRERVKHSRKYCFGF